MDSHRSAQLAVLAARLGLLQPDQLSSLQQEAAAGSDVALRMTERGWLQETDVEHLVYLLDRVPAQDEHMETTLKPDDGSAAMGATPLLPMSGDTRAAPTLQSAAGRFHIEKLHATGGIGRVWIARDESLGRDVALKDLRPESGHAGHQLRFLEEARITARLQHPGIVPVYELSRRTEDGQPYYVMRFVKGRTLQEAIKQYHAQRQPVEFQRLMQAFRAIGQTLAYAHAQGVLHRDLKPANVLLGDFGEVLVVDWGLAKTSTTSDSGRSADCKTDSDADGSVTREGQVLGTPAYMSPEQAAGDIAAIDARSDVWGLGAILYELLTGAQPFRGTSVANLLHLVRTADPAKPRSRNCDVPPALEAICLKALAKDPGQRYATAAAMTDDVNRWLADEPVHAYVEPITQRLVRWARRHRTLVTTASALLIAAVIGLTVSTILIGQQRDRAEVNLKTALDAVETFYVQVSENRLLNEPGMQPLRAELLRSAVKFCDKFAAENQHDPLRQADLARMQLLLGKVQMQIDEPKLAHETLDRSRAMYAALRKQAPTKPEWIRGEALADLNIGLLLRTTKPKRAKEAYESAIAGFEQLEKAGSASMTDQEKLALAHNNLGHWLREHDQFDAAMVHYANALRQIEALVKADPLHRDYQHDLAGFHSNIGEALLQRRKPAEARTHLTKALGIRDDLARHKVKDLALDEHQASTHNLLGHLSLAEKDFAAAEKHFGEALRLRQIVAQANPSVHRFKVAVGLAHSQMGRAYERQGRYPPALTEVAKAVEVFQGLQKEFPKEALYARHLGTAHMNQAYFLYDADRTKESVAAFTEAIRWLEAARAIDPTSSKKDLLNSYWTRAMGRNDLGDLKQAVADYDRALALDDGSQRQAIEAERQKVLARIRKDR